MADVCFEKGYMKRSMNMTTKLTDVSTKGLK